MDMSFSCLVFNAGVSFSRRRATWEMIDARCRAPAWLQRALPSTDRSTAELLDGRDGPEEGGGARVARAHQGWLVSWYQVPFATVSACMCVAAVRPVLYPRLHKRERARESRRSERDAEIMRGLFH